MFSKCMPDIPRVRHLGGSCSKYVRPSMVSPIPETTRRVGNAVHLIHCFATVDTDVCVRREREGGREGGGGGKYG